MEEIKLNVDAVNTHRNRPIVSSNPNNPNNNNNNNNSNSNLNGPIFKDN